VVEYIYINYMKHIIMNKIETIKNITEFENGDNSGYKITTSNQIIELSIDNYQRCCEDWGYFISNDEIKSFINSNVLSIIIVDDELNTHIFNKNMEDIYMEECSTMFVNIETNNGTLQFVAYNSHNGYYSHKATLISTQLKYETDL